MGGHNGAHGVTRPTCFGSPRPPSLTQYGLWDILVFIAAARESELFQEPQIIPVKQADVIDPIPNHGYPFDAEPEGPPAPHFRVVADILKDRRVHHAAACNFEPFLAHLARQRAAEINFKAWFGVAEIVRAETDAGLRPHQLVEHKFHRAFEIAD